MGIQKLDQFAQYAKAAHLEPRRKSTMKILSNNS